MLEGIDLGCYRFETGNVYEVELRVAEVLIVWNYAERIGPDPFRSADKQFA